VLPLFIYFYPLPLITHSIRSVTNRYDDESKLYQGERSIYSHRIYTRTGTLCRTVRPTRRVNILPTVEIDKEVIAVQSYIVIFINSNSSNKPSNTTSCFSQVSSHNSKTTVIICRRQHQPRSDISRRSRRSYIINSSVIKPKAKQSSISSDWIIKPYLVYYQVVQAYTIVSILSIRYFFKPYQVFYCRRLLHDDILLSVSSIYLRYQVSTQAFQTGSEFNLKYLARNRFKPLLLSVGITTRHTFYKTYLHLSRISNCKSSK